MPKTIFIRKPVNLAEVKNGTEECKRLFDSKGEDYYVAEELELSNQEWERVTSSLLEDRYCFHQFSERNLPKTEEGTPCMRLTTPGSEIALIVDTQGYDYARYVGIEAADASSEIEEEDDEEEPAEEEPDELTEEEVVDGLRALLMGESLDCTSLDSNVRTSTYQEAGYFTRDAGFEIRMANGQCFTITVKEGR